MSCHFMTWKCIKLIMKTLCISLLYIIEWPTKFWREFLRIKNNIQILNVADRIEMGKFKYSDQSSSLLGFFPLIFKFVLISASSPTSQFLPWLSVQTLMCQFYLIPPTPPSWWTVLGWLTCLGGLLSKQKLSYRYGHSALFSTELGF